jgi:2-amino-4-hydroxy-6-hydroxymethyldihydropteridine diphosphokinase
MRRVYVSLGSNIEPEINICQALAALHANFANLLCSTIYQSAAVGFEGNPFLNAVAAFETDYSSLALKTWLKALEEQQGRERGAQKFSARTLDLDLLLYDDWIQAEQKLPHPDILHYHFVLQPLAELAPELKHPILGISYSDLATKQLEIGEQMPLKDIQLDCAKTWQVNEQSAL